MGKLYEVIAVEKGVKSRVYGELTVLDKAAQKPEPFNGFSKNYTPLDEAGEVFPEESKKVTMRAEDVLAQIAKLNTSYFDLEFTKDVANQSASADVVVDGKVIIKKAPVALLLFLEKQVTDIRTMLERMPVLDETKEWSFDTTSSLYRTAVTRTHKTRKTPKVLVKAEATDKHPAQTEVYHEDVVIGHWSTTHLSGAFPLWRRTTLVERLTGLLSAIKVARQRCNDTEAVPQSVGESLFKFLFA